MSNPDLGVKPPPAPPPTGPDASPEDDTSWRVRRLEGTEAWHPDGTGPYPTENGPVRRRWRKVALRTLGKAWGDSLFGMSSQAAFWCALSTAPLLLALLGLSGYVARAIGPTTTTDIRDQVTVFLHTIFNEEVADNLIGNTVDTILNNGQADVVSVGLVISLWAGSSAMTAFVESINIAYCQHEFRHPVVERFFALGLYVGALAAGIFVVPLLAIGPDYLPRMFPVAWRPTVIEILGWAYYPGLGIGLIVLLTTLYKVAPKHKHAWKRGLPGALLAAAVFLVASTGLRLYLSYVYAHGLTYGALATPITFLLFYYFISMAIIIGAQFNNALLEYYPPRRGKKARNSQERTKDAVTAGATPAGALVGPDGSATSPQAGGPSGSEGSVPAARSDALSESAGSETTPHSVTPAAGPPPTSGGSEPAPHAGTLSGSSGPGMGSTGAGGKVSGVSGSNSPGSSGTGSAGSIGG